MGLALPQVVTSDRASGAQIVDGSLRFDSGSSNYLNRTPSSAGNRKTWTWSGWIKRDSISAYQHSFIGGSNSTGHGVIVRFSPASAGTDTLQIGEYVSGWNWELITDRVFRDTGWYHIVFDVDTTQTTTADRVKLYINGVQETSFGTSSYPSLNYDTLFNTNTLQVLGGQTWNGSINGYYNGRMSNVYFIDGAALGPENFGFTDPLTNTWRPKKFKSSLNNGTTWSSGISGTLGGSSVTVENPTEAFDGMLDGSAQFNTTANNAGILTWTVPGGGIPASNFRIFTYQPQTISGYNYAMSINGGAYVQDAGNWATVAVNGDGWSTLQNVPNGFLTSIALRSLYTGNGTVRIYGIEVDGIVLIDGATNDFGTNGFYLPMDGNSPIGEDKSGTGNNWTPVNFGGSLELDNLNVSGARPILNTGTGGTVARPGVFGSEVGFRDTVSSSSGGGNPYIFDTNGTRPTFNFIRGATYVFDYSSATSHPLRFATAADAAGSTEYTDGTSVSGNVISFTVPHNAPNTLYYYCTNHSGMGNSISVTTDETKADPYAWKNVLALPLVGSKDDVSNQINSGSTTKTTAVTGNAASNSSASNFYNASFYFDGTDDYTDTTMTALGTRDFTLEFWCYTAVTQGYQTLLEYGDHSSNGFLMTYRDGTGMFVRNTGAVDISNATYASPSKDMPKDKWHHIALTRESNTAKLFINGKYIGNATFSTNYTATNIRLGHATYSAGGTSEDLNGYIQDVRLYDGAVKYTGTTINEQSFIVPSTSPDILPDTPSGVSGSSKLAKVTDGAVHFDGSGDKLTVPNSSGDFDFGSGDFTIESYLYMTAQTLGDAIISLYNYGANRRAWNYYYNKTTNTFRLFVSTNGSGQILRLESSGPVSLNRWTHVAVTKASNVYRMFFDGVQVGTTTVSETIFGTGTTADSVGIGDYAHTDAEPYSGFISNIRILKGTALYTSEFTPPTRELTNVTNTKLLCCQSNKSAGAAAVSPNISGINDGTVWSDGADPALANFDGIQAIFDGSLTTRGGDTNTAYLTYVNNASISASTGIRIYWNGVGSGQRYIRINGTTELDDGSDQLTPGWSSVSSFSGTINKIEIKTANTGSFAISAIEIDGTILIDPVTANGDAAATNFNPFNTDINTVRGQESGYATLNPLDMGPNGALSDGNLNFKSSTSSWSETKSTIKIPTTGKWYVEQIYRGGSSNLSPSSWGARYSFFGVCTNNYVFGNAGGSNCLVLSDTNFISKFGTQTAASGAVTKGPGGTVSLALSRDDNTYEFFYQGVSIDSGTIGTTDSELFFMVGHHPGNTTSFDFNFGQKPFKFPPPAGYQPLNAANVKPETVITRPDRFVNVSTWTGNNSTQSLTGMLFKPDFFWSKSRTTTWNNGIFDTVRGTNVHLRADTTAAEYTPAAPNFSITSYNSDGVTFGPDAASATVNYTGGYVGWAWKAGGNKNTFNVDDVGYASAAAAGLNGGSIAVTGASVGTRQGFSIIKYTGTGTAGTISHGLLEQPKFVIIKDLKNANAWAIQHVGTTLGIGLLKFNTAAVDSSVSGPVWNSTAPTSSVFSVGTSNDTNGTTNSAEYITYLWHDVPGLQKFGKYIGNNSADGPFIELGFRPSIILFKSTASGKNWFIYDTERDSYNVVENYLIPDSAGAEAQFDTLDILSNGFKFRTNDGSFNASGAEHIYAAWAEAPTVNLYGAQSNAR